MARKSLILLDVERAARYSTCSRRCAFIAGWSSLVARRAHNPKVVGSNPAPATIRISNPLSAGFLLAINATQASHYDRILNFMKYALMLCSSSKSACLTFSASIASVRPFLCCSSSCIRFWVASLKIPCSIALTKLAMDFSTLFLFASSPS